MEGPLKILVLVAIWVAFLWYPMMRSARAIAFLVVATVAYLGADVAPEPWSIAIRVGVAVVVAAMLLRFDYLLSALPPAALRFRRSYVAINKGLLDAYSEYERTREKAPLETALQDAKADLSALRLPPGAEWSRLQESAINLIDERLEMLLTGTETDPATGTRFRTHRGEVQNQLNIALTRTKSFWR
ncbi:MAG: hypothetical protein ACRDGH_01705 [Candidatus Limnocylindria bacterium]